MDEEKLNRHMAFSNTKRHYKIIVLTPSGLEGVGNARTVLEEALKPLNSHTIPPGLRFHDNVTAECAVMHDMDAVEKMVRKDRNLALVIACGYGESELENLVFASRAKKVELCHAKTFVGEEPEPEKDAVTFEPPAPYDGVARNDEEEEARRYWRELYERDFQPNHDIDKAVLLDTLSPATMEDRVCMVTDLLALTICNADMNRSPLRS